MPAKMSRMTRKPPPFTIVTSWTAEDVKTLRPRWSLERCEKWLYENRKAISERSIELGWEVIEILL